MKTVLQIQGTVELIPAARRLMTSLRDMGYEFTTAVADLVDNSVEAGATRVVIDIEFEGENSWVRIADNGAGMTSAALREAMRYGSSRDYAEEDLGKFGLGLKVASLSQCQRLTVASRTSRSRAEIGAYCWDLAHIETTNRWELLPVTRRDDSPPVHSLLKESVGTVVLWQKLDRILGYQDPGGESARRRLAAMCRDVEGHLAMVFHRFLDGEAKGRRKLQILVNGRAIGSWDPFARSEPATKRLDPASIPVRLDHMRGVLLLEPFILPHQSEFSSADSFRRASGPANWNQQQGFYVYRADRLIQSGGWCRIRTLDEHTKLARVALRFSPQLDDAFRVNVSKMRVQLPATMRDLIIEAISPVTKLANDRYRRTAAHADGRGSTANLGALKLNGHGAGMASPRPVVAGRSVKTAVDALLAVANASERNIIRRVAARLTAE
jgi:anti-sigma regulatory factor (Ser/Thr protein kinase)